MNAVYLKELSSYFKSARGYICLGLYFLFGGQFLLMQLRYQGTNDLSAVFADMYLVVLLTLPMLTMRLLAEEKRTRTDQALFTAPVALWEIVWGKFLAACTVFVGGISVFVVYYLVVRSLSGPNLKMFLGNYIGLLLLGAAMISIGVFVSAMTESQMVAAIGTFGCMIFLVILDSVGDVIPASFSFLEKALSALAIGDRFSDFTSGILKIENILFFVSVVVFFNYLTVRRLDKNRWVANKRINNRLYAAGSTVVFLAVLVLVNVLTVKIAGRFPVLDMTDNSLYRLSEESVEIAENLETDVQILVCYEEEKLRETDYGKQMDEFLKAYSRCSDKITVRFVDLLKEPEIASKYADFGVQSGSILFESDLRTKASAIKDCIETTTTDANGGYEYESKTEQVLTSGILYVSDQSVMQVTVLTGHQEAGSNDILNYLKENNYEIKEQNIQTEEIDTNSEMVFLLAPMTDYSAEEMEKLDRYLDNDGKFGKHLFYAAAYNQPELPGLESFLEEWGIRIGKSLIAETDTTNAYDTQGFMFGAEFTEDAAKYLEEVKNPSLPVIGYYCRPLELAWEEKNNRTAEYLIWSKDSAVLYQLEDGKLTGAKEEEKKRYGIAVLGDRLKYEGMEERHSSVLAFASASMFSSSGAVSDNFNNHDFTVALINQLNGKQNGVAIEGRSFHAQKLNLTQAAYQTIAVILGVVLPLLCFVLGGCMTVYRRRL